MGIDAWLMRATQLSCLCLVYDSTSNAAVEEASFAAADVMLVSISPMSRRNTGRVLDVHLCHLYK